MTCGDTAMFRELTAEEQSKKAYMDTVKFVAKRLALTHIADVIAASESILRRARSDLHLHHDGKVSSVAAVFDGGKLAKSLLVKLSNEIEVSAVDCVRKCDRKKRLTDDEVSRLAYLVDEYVADVLKKLRSYEVIYEDN